MSLFTWNCEHCGTLLDNTTVFHRCLTPQGTTTEPNEQTPYIGEHGEIKVTIPPVDGISEASAEARQGGKSDGR